MTVKCNIMGESHMHMLSEISLIQMTTYLYSYKTQKLAKLIYDDRNQNIGYL